MKMLRGTHGYTIVELTLATFLALVVVMGMGSIFLQNQRSWGWTQDKTMLQANATEAVEWIGRRVRGAYAMKVFNVNPGHFRVYDQKKIEVYTFEIVNVGGSPRLQENRRTMIDRPCTRFVVTPDPDDSTNVKIDVEFEDHSGNRVAAFTQFTVRSRSFLF